MSRVTNEVDDQRDFHPPPSTPCRDLFHALLSGSRREENVSSYSVLSNLARNVKSCKDQRLEMYCSFCKIFDAGGAMLIFSFSPSKIPFEIAGEKSFIITRQNTHQQLYTLGSTFGRRDDEANNIISTKLMVFKTSSSSSSWNVINVLMSS